MDTNVIEKLKEFSNNCKYSILASNIQGHRGNVDVQTLMFLLSDGSLNNAIRGNGYRSNYKCPNTGITYRVNANFIDIYNILSLYMKDNPVYVKCINGSRKGTVGRLKFTVETDNAMKQIREINNTKESYMRYVQPYNIDIPFAITFDDSNKVLNGVFPSSYSEGKFTKDWIISFDENNVTEFVFSKNEKKEEIVETDYTDFFGNTIAMGDVLFGSIGTKDNKKLRAAKLIKITPTGLLKVETINLKGKGYGKNTFLLDRHDAEQTITSKKFSDIHKHIVFLYMKNK